MPSFLGEVVSIVWSHYKLYNLHYNNMRVLMGVPSYQLTTNFSANCQLTTISLASCQLTTNFS